MKYLNKQAFSFSLFASCFPTRGVTRSIIIDTYRGGFDFIPNDLYDILTIGEWTTLGDLYNKVGSDNIAILDEYLDFLSQKEYIFWYLPIEKELFPPLPEQWFYPGKISNAILDWDSQSDYPLLTIIEELDELQCQALQLRCFSAVDDDFLETIFQQVEQSTIEQLDLILHFNPQINEERFYSWAIAFQKLTNIQVHSAPQEQILRDRQIDKICTIFYTTEQVDDETHCGIVGMPYFTTNIPHYMESLAHNTCLNRKISVDRKGEIKNCPSLDKGFGKAGKTRLVQALDHPKFQERWHIHKAEVKDCQVCEFRHICTDCRAYLTDPIDLYSKPAKCTYNPYTGIWANSSTLQAE
ncbi:MAG: grasp-with-spasm system SPASM domain peptide maturase [Lewinellaceae bacterium]|nr:grasp-with-spasm system SPASM domain peptide maturase [Lewinellaceae bacterium]